MMKKKITILVLTLCIISQIFLIFAIPKIENLFLRNDTWEKSTKTKTELPHLSLTQTWAPNGTIISTASDNQYSPEICSDGAGGAIITWEDYRTGSNYDIYAQGINSSGNVQWTADGVAICTASNSQVIPQICNDGAGGAIITWMDYRGGTYSDIYAQRIDSSGNVQWTSNGVAICTASNDQEYPEICSDGVGGAIITWTSVWTGSISYIYAQRINSSGNVQWTSNGVAICTPSYSQFKSEICSDGAGGAIITWTDKRSGIDDDIYAQRIDPSGNVQWTADGVAICTASNYQQDPQICSDGAEGAIITWQDFRGGPDYDIYAQRIDSSGNVQWTANGVAICTASNNQWHPQICSNDAGGAIITWPDLRSGLFLDIYAQRIDSSGNVQWTANGVAICTASNIQEYPEICSDGAGGAIITWQDSRGGSNYDIYAQRIDSSGNVHWIADGVAICTAISDEYRPEICSSGAESAIITWQDYRSRSNYDIYAQRIVDITSIYIGSPENNTYTASMSGYYPAVFGFENQLPGVMPNDWIIYQSSGTGYLRTVDELDGHKKVLDFYSGVNGDYCYYEKNLKKDVTNGTIEFWFQTTDVWPPMWYSWFMLSDGISESERNIRLCIREGALSFFNSTDYLLVDSIVPNQWYHLRIDFNMIADTSTIYLNNVLKLSNVDNYGNGSQINTIQVTNHYNLANTHLYLDAIGYSWDPHYSIGNNLKEGLLLSLETNSTQFWGSYSVDGQTNITILGNTTISMLEDGPHTIQVFNKNLFGDLIQSELRHFTIDTKNPEIVIHLPNQFDIFGVIPPKYNISIVEANLVSSWYTLDRGATNYTFTDLYGYIAEDAWLTAPNGSCTIEFYARDVAGKLGYKNITVVKDVKKFLNVDILNLSISDEIFNITLFVYNEFEDGIDSGTIQIWWNGNDVSSSVQNLGSGLYFIMLDPITVAIGEDPILLNMTISADGYLDKYYETFISVQPWNSSNLLFVDIIDCSFSTEEFNITFIVFNESGQAVNLTTIQLWWNGNDVSLSIQNLGSGLYFIMLNPITVAIGEDPILLNMTISADGYLDKYYETFISVQPWDSSNLLFVEIIDSFYSLEEFNITFSVFNESGHVISFLTIQLWWNGIDVSSSVQNLGGGLHFISLEPITVASGSDPIILIMIVSASGYEDKHFTTKLSVDPETLQKIPEEGDPTKEIPFEIILVIASFIGIAAVIGIATTLIIKKRRKIE
jgi:hypothetical protein